MNRRDFMKTSTAGFAGVSALGLSGISGIRERSGEMFFKISLAQWSLNKTLFSGELTNLDFPGFTRSKFDINAIEYVNQFFPSAEEGYIKKLKQRTNDEGVKNVLIMIDGEGDLGDLYRPKRMRAVERHYPWVEAAALLGCHSIRVNARGRGSAEEVAGAATEALAILSEFGKKHEINILVENHGGYSSNGKWLAEVIKNTGMDNCGTLPDFGNFRISNEEEYDKYEGVRELMPFAKGVSAKSHSFNSEGNEEGIDYHRMMRIVKDAGYSGYVGIEYEGRELAEEKGIIATRDLLLKIGAEIS